jgi:hypothetical protein
MPPQGRNILNNHVGDGSRKSMRDLSSSGGRTIRVSQEVFEAMQARAVAFEDTPDSVMRRVFKLDQPQVRRPKNDRCKGVCLNGKQCSRQSQAGIDFCGMHYTTPSHEIEPNG